MLPRNSHTGTGRGAVRMSEVFEGKAGVPELVLRQQRHPLPADFDAEGFAFSH